MFLKAVSQQGNIHLIKSTVKRRYFLR